MKDTKSLLLVLLSFCIVGTWVYHLYDKREFARHPNVVYEKEPTSWEPLAKDSSVQPEPITEQQDTTNEGAEARLEGIVSLRNEIASLLGDSNITKKDLYKAEEKIRILQKNISALSSLTDSLLKAKEKNDTKGKVDAAIIAEPVDNTRRRISIIPTPPPPLVRNAEVRKAAKEPDKEPQQEVEDEFKASQVQLKALGHYDQDKAQAPIQAKQTTGFDISFQLKNNSASYNNTAIYMVLTDPDGSVIEDDLWETGIINSKKDGLVRYTRKINIEYSQGESKKIDLSIQLPKFPAGRYKLSLYHNGIRIGKSNLDLF